MGDSWQYIWEPDIAGTIQFPHGVKFLVASFPTFFGSQYGEVLRRWCTRQRWALVWSLGVGDRGEVFGRLFSGNQRLVDPVVAVPAGLNITAVPHAGLVAYNATWKEAAAVGGSGGGSGGGGNWSAMWGQLKRGLPRALQLRPLSAGDCADIDACIGVDTDVDDCVCYPGTDVQGGDAALPEEPLVALRALERERLLPAVYKRHEQTHE